ncbi:hypothetical protein niasHT_036524 [Heterodera trifolii]|uniref:Caspase family p20 domain-containing protein n=1 Tax=Heterodera trifolii TaxID=157864 RepID=A0ABD2IM99_9BILA
MKSSVVCGTEWCCVCAEWWHCCRIWTRYKFWDRENRDGTNVDQQNMEKLLSSLGHIVYTNHNQTAEQDVVLGTDGVGINMHEFASEMNATGCLPTISRKAKASHTSQLIRISSLPAAAHGPDLSPGEMFIAGLGLCILHLQSVFSKDV